MIAELKPCPFCRAELEEQAPGYFVHPASTECILSMQEYDFDGAPELADLWNRRAQPAEEVQLMHHIMKHAVRGSTYQTVTSLNVLVDAQILEKHGRRAAINAAMAKDTP